MSVEDIQSLAKLILIIVSGGIGAVATVGFVVVCFLFYEGDE